MLTSAVLPQDADGKLRDTWNRTPIRVTDLQVSPDFTRLVAVGMYDAPSIPPGPSVAQDGGGMGGVATGGTSAGRVSETRVVIYDLATKQPESCVFLATLASRSAVLLAHEVRAGVPGICVEWTDADRAAHAG